VRFLLDTHVLLWALGDVERLTPSVREAIQDPANDIFVSAASGWEIGIKVAIGKLHIPDDLEEQMRAADLVTLPVTFDDGMAVRSLPRHHEDPFDRLLIVQAMARQLTIVTGDRRITRYAVQCLELGPSTGTTDGL
jgi:PIN domain nuclease of toxin-antitoxin system